MKQFGGQFVFGTIVGIYDVKNAETEQLELDVKSFVSLKTF